MVRKSEIPPSYNLYDKPLLDNYNVRFGGKVVWPPRVPEDEHTDGDTEEAGNIGATDKCTAAIGIASRMAGGIVAPQEVMPVE